jgi:hypothetical protein
MRAKNLHPIILLGGSDGFILSIIIIIPFGLKQRPNITLFYYVSSGTFCCLVCSPDGSACPETHVNFTFL